MAPTFATRLAAVKKGSGSGKKKPNKNMKAVQAKPSVSA